MNKIEACGMAVRFGYAGSIIGLKVKKSGWKRSRNNDVSEKKTTGKNSPRKVSALR